VSSSVTVMPDILYPQLPITPASTVNAPDHNRPRNGHVSNPIGHRSDTDRTQLQSQQPRNSHATATQQPTAMHPTGSENPTGSQHTPTNRNPNSPVGPDGSTGWPYPVALPDSLHLVALPGGSTWWLYMMGSTWWLYPVALPGGSTRWLYLVALPDGST